MENWIPIPHSWREALWLVVAIFIATRKGIRNGAIAFWRTWRTATADADKTYAEAERIRTKTAVDSAQFIREMSVSFGEAVSLAGQLKEKIASKDSIIELQRAKICDLEARISELGESQVKKA